MERITETRMERRKRLRENKSDRFIKIVAKTWVLLMVALLLSTISSIPISNIIKGKHTYVGNRGFESVIYERKN